MILGHAAGDAAPPPASAGGPTLDDLFTRALARNAHALALADAPNRPGVDGRPALRLSFAQADRAVSAIADRLRRLGLQTDHVVALHMPNTVEAVLTLLGVLRAGMIAAPLPLLWRRAEAAAALSRVGAKAIVTLGQVGATNLAELAARVAAEVFQIRAVGAFGCDLPDGVTPFDPLLASEQSDPLPAIERAHDPAAHVAVVTFDTDAAGPLPVAHSHSALIAAGLAVALEREVAPADAIVSLFPPASLAGLAAGVVAWLVSGGTLHLHARFDCAALSGQIEEARGCSLVIPGPLAPPLAESGALARASDLRAVVAVWRAPERLSRAPEWPDQATRFVDLQAFGEIGLIAARRGADGAPARVALGWMTAPRGAPAGMPVAELARTPSGTLAMRGPMVPSLGYPAGRGQDEPPFVKIDEELYVDTGHPCRVERETGTMVVTAPPPGLVGIGGYRIAIDAYREVIGEIDGEATLAALPDALTGQRLAGRSSDDAALREALARRGVNPLVTGAFRERRAVTPAAADETKLRRAG